MAGAILRMVDAIVDGRSKGNPTVAVTTRTKLLLKGVDPEKYNASSPDDPAIIAKLRAIAADLGVAL